MTSFVALGMWSEGNTPKIGEPAVGFSFMAMLQHTSQFRSRFLHKEQSETSLTWFLTISVTNAIEVSKASCFYPGEAGVYLFPWLKSALMWKCFCDATDVIKNVTIELKRLSQNGFQACINTFRVIGRSV